ncbi:MAG: amidohydrolase family protein [Deltaproteobacteria bacterium]|nr:amidohydrolase family protein [Deltaproteobacteria bacterium]
MTYDVLLSGGTIVDGTGKGGFIADVGIAGDRIVAVEPKLSSKEAHQVVDARGLVVCPGFIDHHTHYDAQVLWDPMITCSSWHGVTSIIMGNCGVGLAPCKPADREALVGDLVNVEGMSLDVLQRGVQWSWESVEEYLQAISAKGVGVNVGFMVPLSPLRQYVLGEESKERAATEKEIAQLRSLFRAAMDAGAFGFSTTVLPQHLGFQGRPLPCRLASRDELRALAGVLKELKRGSIEIALTRSPGILSDEEFDILTFLLMHSERPVTWLGLLQKPEAPPDAWKEALNRVVPLFDRGYLPLGQVPCHYKSARFSLKRPFIFGNFDCWKVVFDRPLAEQRQLYASQEFRTAFRDEMRQPRLFTGQWNNMSVFTVNKSELHPLLEKSIETLARERGKDPVDLFFDLALTDDLNMQFLYEFGHVNKDMLTHPHTLIGLSDGGAHADMRCEAGYSTYLLGTVVREKNMLPLEEAIRRLTSVPAQVFGVPLRGTVAPGMIADLVVFDPDKVSCGKQEAVNDFPGGGLRYIEKSTGITQTIVNGKILYANGESQNVLPGRVLRANVEQ